jgi:hypothetical protein
MTNKPMPEVGVPAGNSQGWETGLLGLANMQPRGRPPANPAETLLRASYLMASITTRALDSVRHAD